MDYAAISTGSTQATASRVIGVGRSGAGRASRLVHMNAAALIAPLAALDPRAVVGQGRELASGLIPSDFDDLVSRLGLAKKSEVNAVRQQLHRLERRLGEVRGER